MTTHERIWFATITTLTMTAIAIAIYIQTPAAEARAYCVRPPHMATTCETPARVPTPEKPYCPMP